MAEYKDLLKLKVVTDDDTGMYYIGEVDGGFTDLKGFLEDNGLKGRDELLLTLSVMQSKIINNFEEIMFEKRKLLDRGYNQI